MSLIYCTFLCWFCFIAFIDCHILNDVLKILKTFFESWQTRVKFTKTISYLLWSEYLTSRRKRRARKIKHLPKHLSYWKMNFRKIYVRTCCAESQHNQLYLKCNFWQRDLLLSSLLSQKNGIRTEIYASRHLKNWMWHYLPHLFLTHWTNQSTIQLNMQNLHINLKYMKFGLIRGYGKSRMDNFINKRVTCIFFVRSNLQRRINKQNIFLFQKIIATVHFICNPYLF